jgi:hypothetical protein
LACLISRVYGGSAELDCGTAPGRRLDLDRGEDLVFLAVVSGLVAEEDVGLAARPGIVAGQLLVEFLLLSLLVLLLASLLFPYPAFLLLDRTILWAKVEIALIAILLNWIGHGILLEGFGFVVFSGSFQ